MNEGILERSLTIFLEKWSDENLKRAEQFVEAHKNVVPGKIGINQLYGIQRTTSQGSDLLHEYITNRIRRAQKSGPFQKDVEDYYNNLLQEFVHIDNETVNWVKQIENRDKEKIVSDLRIQMKSKFIQHLISHSNF